MTLIRGTEELVQELVRRLRAGESFNNMTLKRLADKFFGGVRVRGAYTPRDSYDALETAVNKFILETLAAKSVCPVKETVTELRALLDHLPSQTTRTTEQIEFQQFSTPPTIAFMASRLLDVQPNDLVLEPSAGTGSLAIWPQAMALSPSSFVTICLLRRSTLRALLAELPSRSFPGRVWPKCWYL